MSNELFYKIGKINWFVMIFTIYFCTIANLFYKLQDYEWSARIADYRILMLKSEIFNIFSNILIQLFWRIYTFLSIKNYKRNKEMLKYCALLRKSRMLEMQEFILHRGQDRVLLILSFRCFKLLNNFFIN